MPKIEPLPLAPRDLQRIRGAAKGVWPICVRCDQIQVPGEPIEHQATNWKICGN